MYLSRNKLVTINPGILGRSWSPQDLGSSLVAWYDANDAATLTLVSGKVSQWNDKSGNGYHLVQGTNGNRPAYSATSFQQGTPGVTFDGTDDFMSAGSVSLSTNKHSAFAFAQSDAGLGTFNQLLSYQADGDAGPFSTNSVIWLQVNGTGAQLDSYRAGDKSIIQQTDLGGGILDSTIPNGGVYYRWSSVFDGSTNIMYIDHLGKVGSSVAASGTLGSPGTILLGARADASEAHAGAVNEIIIMNRDATLAERAQIDTYFQRHWSRVLVVTGDSVPYSTTGFAYTFIPNASPAVFLCNRAISGTDFLTNAGPCLIDRAAAREFKYVPTNKMGRKYIYFISFTNNIASSGSQTYVDTIASHAAAALAAGFDNVVYATILSRTDAQADDTKRAAVNALTNPTWAANNNITLCDFAADSIMGVDASPTINPTYWADQVHPNAAGHARLEVIFRAAINGVT